jgi:toxin ParE1/3/4
MRYRLSRQANADLEAITDYIIEDNPARAITFVDELTAKFRVIADRPKSFPLRDDLRPGLRSAVHGKYLIFFLVDAEVVDVVRVVHGARNLPAIFQGEVD